MMVIKCCECGASCICSECTGRAPPGWTAVSDMTVSDMSRASIRYYCPDCSSRMTIPFPVKDIGDAEDKEGTGTEDLDSVGEGYAMHKGQKCFTCDRCKGSVFRMHAQSMPADTSKAWTYEYECALCGQLMGLTLLGRKG